jgi:hypothetical protein
MSVVRRLSCEGQGQGSERKVAGRLVELGSDESLTPFFWSLRIQKGIPNKGRPMKLRCKSFVALSVTVLGLLGSPVDAQTIGQQVDSEQTLLRRQLGIPEKPQGEIVSEVRGLLVTKQEYEQFSNYFKALEAAQSYKEFLDRHPNVLNTFVLPGIAHPTLTISVDPGYKSKLTKELVDLLNGIDVIVEEAPVRRADRDRFAAMLFGEIGTRRQAENSKDEVQVETPILDLVEEGGNRVLRGVLGGSDWRVTIQVSGDPKDVERRMAAVTGSMTSEIPLFKVESGTPERRLNPPKRFATDDMARGGKRLLNTGCTTGPTITSSFVPESILSAGHCYLRYYGTEGTIIPFGGGGSNIAVGSDTIGNVQVQLSIACDRCVAAPPTPWPSNIWQSPPVWWWGQGVDFAMLRPGSNPTQNGYNRSYFLTQGYSDNRSYIHQDGSADPYAGSQLVCFEGASAARPDYYWLHSSCGTAGGVTDDEFRTIAMYWGQPICGGDSGALAHMPTSANQNGFTSSFVTGVLSAGGGPTIPGLPDCNTSTPAENGYAYISSFWKIHNYMLRFRTQQPPYNNVTPWVLTY